MKPALALALALGVLPLAGCYQVGAAGKTNRIELLGSFVVDGYKFDQYRNLVVSLQHLRLPDVRDRDEGGLVRHADAAALGAHARRRRRLLRLQRDAAALRRQQVRGVGGHLDRLRKGHRPDGARARRPGRVPAAVGVDVQPRHLLRRRSARSQQPEHVCPWRRAARSTGCSRPRRRSSSRARSTRPASSSCTGRARVRRAPCPSPGALQEQGIRPPARWWTRAGEHRVGDRPARAGRLSRRWPAQTRGAGGDQGPHAVSARPTSRTSPTSWSAAAS